MIGRATASLARLDPRHRSDHRCARIPCRYLGLNFEVALEEIQLHDAVSERGKFRIAQPEIDRRWAHDFSSIFNRMDLTGPLHKRLGGHAGLPRH